MTGGGLLGEGEEQVISGIYQYKCSHWCKSGHSSRGNISSVFKGLGRKKSVSHSLHFIYRVEVRIHPSTIVMRRSFRHSL